MIHPVFTNEEIELFKNLKSTRTTVMQLYNVGAFLNRAEGMFQKKSEYTSWLRSEIDDDMQCSQQAKRLARLDKNFVENYHRIGKGRMLSFEAYRFKNEFKKILWEHPLPDPNMETSKLNSYFDTILSLYRLNREDIYSIEFDRMYNLTLFGGRALFVKEASILADKIHSSKGDLNIEYEVRKMLIGGYVTCGKKEEKIISNAVDKYLKNRK